VKFVQNELVMIQKMNPIVSEFNRLAFETNCIGRYGNTHGLFICRDTPTPTQINIQDLNACATLETKIIQPFGFLSSHIPSFMKWEHSCICSKLVQEM